MSDLDLALNLRARGITDEKVIAAMASLDRRRFVPADQLQNARYDLALPIGHQQTISQPFVVAYMTQALELQGTERVLEIGTGSGYQTAVLARLCREVYSVEIIPELAQAAHRRLSGELGLENVRLRRADGRLGWPSAAPFDAVLVTAAAERIPEAWVEQLAVGGRLVTPVGPQDGDQELIRVRRIDGDVEVQKLLDVRFVPLTRDELPQ